MHSSRLIPVEGHEGFARDPKTGAVINTNKSDYQKYKAVSAARKNFDQKIEDTAAEVASLKEEITEIKQLLVKLVDGINT
jgi:wobble nucleotide-excising tRNase|tara:strand:- start:518 stop:757 length:240 start_codon:yes stop_codon:yes gene_type:complete